MSSTFKYFSFLKSHSVCVTYGIICIFFFGGLHSALHLYNFGYIMKRSPVTVGGRGLINHRGRKNLIWERAFFIPLPLLKCIIHPYRYWGYRKGLRILITLLSIFFNWLNFRTFGLCPSWSSFTSLLSALCDWQWEFGFLLFPLSIRLLWLNSSC